MDGMESETAFHTATQMQQGGVAERVAARQGPQRYARGRTSRLGLLQVRAKSKAYWQVVVTLVIILLVAALGTAGWLFVDGEGRPGKLVEKVKNKQPPAQGRGLISLGPRAEGFLYDANIPPAQKKILWQKMKKHRSAN